MKLYSLINFKNTILNNLSNYSINLFQRYFGSVLSALGQFITHSSAFAIQPIHLNQEKSRNMKEL